MLFDLGLSLLCHGCSSEMQARLTLDAAFSQNRPFDMSRANVGNSLKALPLPHRRSTINERRVLTWPFRRRNDRNVEGFRASSDVRKPSMQEPAVGRLWSMGISDSGGASAVHQWLPDGMR